MSRRVLLAVVGLLAVVAVPTCAAREHEQTVHLTIHHSRFSAAELRVRPGTTVRFVVRNTDPIAHELIVGDDLVQAAHEAGTDPRHEDRPGELSVGLGSVAVTRFRFGPPGRALQFGCHLPGHWAYGMHGAIRVG